ncbi:MAG: ATP-binding protein [Methanobrevibacter sp.]|nr:ATP-binding protein [Candidatus Methanovirga australis]
MSTKSELSLDVSDFEKLIKRNKIYIDKTKVIKRLRDLNGTYHFLSRPRRFGKSLLISTLKNLFEGKEKLFKNTYIYNHWDWNETYPVIHLDLNNLKAMSPENFEKSLRKYMDFVAKDNFNIELEEGFSNEKLMYLITKVYKTYKKEVVVLVDEYDKPILDNINNTETVGEIQRILKDFYGILKSADSKLEFVFITGITQFSKVSIFSEFNNLIQLTLKEDYSTICGYTQEEVEKYFKNAINNYSNLKNINYQETINKIKYHYDGYSWDGKNFLYNPYSLMNFFEDNEFNNYWFESGTPNFLVKIFKENFNIGNIFKPTTLTKTEFNIFDIENLRQIPLLFQSGYLTISKKEIINDKTKYTLKIPNHEVEVSITENLFTNFYTKAENNFLSKRKEIWEDLKKGSCETLSKYLKKEIINTPYQLKIRNWKYYQTLIYAALKSLGFQTNSEVSMFSGRLDIAIEEEDTHYPFTDEKGNAIIVEVKYTQQNNDVNKLATKALNQIKEKGYYEPYEDNNIIMIGLAIKEIKLKSGGSKINLKCQIGTISD